MKLEINFNQFHDEFDNMNRGNNFSYDGKKAIFDYLEERYEDEDYNLDVIAICRQFSEYEDVEEYLKDYGTAIDKEDYMDSDNILDEDSFNYAVLREIESKTALLETDGEAFVIVDY